MTDLKSELIFEYYGDVEMPEVFEPSHAGVRMFYFLKGGAVKGPIIKGKLLSGGGDWPLIRCDGVNEIDARFTIKTDDNALIYAHYRGVAVMPPEVNDRIQKGEDVDPSEYYFRTTPVFETGSAKYAWLNQIICVGVGAVNDGRISYKVYKIL